MELYRYVLYVYHTFMLFIYVIIHLCYIYIYDYICTYISREHPIPTEATVRQAKLASTRQSYAFALMKGDGSVVSSSAVWVKKRQQQKGATKEGNFSQGVGLT